MSRIIAVVLGALLLVACGSAAQSDDRDDDRLPYKWREFTYTTNDGQPVVCVVSDFGVSCNWEDAVPQ